MGEFGLKVNSFLTKLTSNSFTLISSVVVCALFVMLVPVPEFMLDILIGSNICLSLIILLTTIKASKPLEFSSLPVMLLLCTLLRLSLNIASTKSILTVGSAGKLIGAFSSYLIRDNLVIGILAFLIILLVQFMVIVKGSERISEIRARFSLDGMPLKFMAIDGELSQGLITESEARARRKEVQAESDFYGAMDGSTKFTKGDTIAGLVISAINIVAGIIVGVMSLDLSITESISRFTLLTIGDGLVSAIPSLMISVSTGIISTRPFIDNDMGSEIFAQLGKNPITFYICSVIMAAFALIPGINKLVFLGIGVALWTIGYFLKNTQNMEVKEEVVIDDIPKTKEIDYSSKFNAEPLLIEVGVGLAPLISNSTGGRIEEKLEIVREQILNTLGFKIPLIRTIDNINISPYGYRIFINGLLAGEYEIQAGKLLATSIGYDELEIDGISTKEPTYGYSAKFINKEDAKLAESKGYSVLDVKSIIARHFKYLIEQNAHELLTREIVKEMIEFVEVKNATVVKEVIPNILSLAQVQQVLSNLLREGVSILHLNLILEALGDNAHLDKDIAVLTDFARLKLKKQIVRSIIDNNKNKKIATIGLTYESEQFLRNSITQNSRYATFLSVDISVSEKLFNQLEEIAIEAVVNGFTPVVVCSSGIRFYLARYIESRNSFLKVLSNEELELQDIERYHAGNIDLIQKS